MKLEIVCSIQAVFVGRRHADDLANRVGQFGLPHRETSMERLELLQGGGRFDQVEGPTSP